MRSPEFNAGFQNLPDELLLANGIMERISPQFHIRDNARTLDAQPLFWLPVHFHYFNLCSKATNIQLEESKHINPQTLAILQSLQNSSLSWLGNVPIKDLARLRGENQNHEFRARLKIYFDELFNSDFADLDKVALNVFRGIEAMLLEHNKHAKEIAEKYDQKHMGTLALSVLTAGAVMNPWLAPFLGAEGVLPLLGKTAVDLFNEQSEKRKLSNSLVGILSTTLNRK